MIKWAWHQPGNPAGAGGKGWLVPGQPGRHPAWIAGWLVCMSDDSPNSPAVSDDELVWYSTSKDKDGLRINIESGSRLGAHVDNKSGKMVYTIMGRSLKGNTPLNVNLGGKSIVVSGENRNGDAVITVTIPAGLEYRTEKSSDGRASRWFLTIALCRSAARYSAISATT